MNSNEIDYITIDGTTKYLKDHHPQYELIKEGTFTNSTEGDYTINTDSSGNTFNLTDLIFMFETPIQNNVASKGAYGQVYFYYSENNAIITENGTWTQEANASAHGLCTWIKYEDGMVIAMGGSQATSSNNWGLRARYIYNFGAANGFIYYPGFSVHRIVIPKVTGTGHYKIYGKRKQVIEEEEE